MKKPLLVAVALGAVAVLVIGNVASASQQGTFTAALVSDIGKFNDKGFNEDQLAGLNEAKAKLGVKTIALESDSSSDYLPNMTTAVREGANIVSAAGYLLAPTEATVAAQFPKVDFTITDDSVKGPDFSKAKSVANIEGLVYASNQSGCLVGYLAGLVTKAKGGKQVIGATGGIEIPAVDDYIVGYNYCAKLADPGIKVLVGYSNDFVAQDKCEALAQGPDPAGLAGRVPGRRRLWSRHAERCGQGGHLGHRRGRRPVLPREERAHERAQAG